MCETLVAKFKIYPKFKKEISAENLLNEWTKLVGKILRHSNSFENKERIQIL